MERYTTSETPGLRDQARVTYLFVPTSSSWRTRLTMTLPASLDDVTPISANILVEQYLTHINNEITALAESMRSLRSRKNSLARILCLPPEILTAVFKHIVEDIKNHSSACRPPARVIVTYVFRHWRRVALECQSLWVIINLTSAYWIRVFLERSKKTALVVAYNTSTLPRDSFEQVLSELPRIKVLQLQSYSSDVDRTLNYLSLQPAPLLQIFKFMVIGVSSHQTPRHISGAIFQGQSPQLRSLELTGYMLSWTSCVFSELRILYVRGITSSTLPELVPALRCMNSLAQLTLEHLSFISGGNDVSFDRVPLVRLKSITLNTTIQAAVALFSHLALPEDAKIALNLTKIEGHQNFSDLFSAMDKVLAKLVLSFGHFVPTFRPIAVASKAYWMGFTLKARRTQNADIAYQSLHVLDLKDIDFLEDKVELLEKLVEDVDWDGHEEVFSESESVPDSYYRCESTCDCYERGGYYY
ncbi:hypothetical protein AZE42_00402 [Rhizopogon vesiculosus]|uniref:F-box domain-containing protein n=1 Tax=Rhizopogon vesiculosus TaxID=180088 RepID=A0A1J8R627_9AGAM|nr:hypothetical protein AZE42_00402 [Rhizopogon vesiculosus]